MNNANTVVVVYCPFCYKKGNIDEFYPFLNEEGDVDPDIYVCPRCGAEAYYIYYNIYRKKKDQDQENDDDCFVLSNL